MSATLVSLRIRNLALAEDIFWEPASGFNAISGETGAGKSMIVGALKLLLGDRADRTHIRTGAHSCIIEAEFQIQDSFRWNPIFSERNVEPCQAGFCLIRRILNYNGSSRNFLNGSPCTLSSLKEIGKYLVDLHGPHDHQSLFSLEEQGRLLDAFANALEQRKKVAETREKYLHLIEEEKLFSKNRLSIERELDLLRYQTEEIFSAQLIPGEEEELLIKQQVAINSRRIRQLSQEALVQLTEGEQSVTTLLSEIMRLVREWIRLDPRASKLLNFHTELGEAIESYLQEIQKLTPDTDSNPQSLTNIEERLDIIQSLKRKYGASISEVLVFANQAQARLDELLPKQSHTNNLKELLREARDALEEAAKELTKRRKAAASQLAIAVQEQLQKLGFQKTGFSVQLTPLSEVGCWGSEKPEFLFAPNPGEPYFPLKAIASSGEISRVLLAIKSVLVEEDEVPILVFDEIDTNIGGEIATMVGKKIRDIAKKKQVLCISHLPQVAALASTHFVVEKQVVAGRSHSVIREIIHKDRVEELARMLGSKATSALTHAKSLLESPAS